MHTRPQRKQNDNGKRERKTPTRGGVEYGRGYRINRRITQPHSKCPLVFYHPRPLVLYQDLELRRCPCQFYVVNRTVVRRKLEGEATRVDELVGEVKPAQRDITQRRGNSRLAGAAPVVQAQYDIPAVEVVSCIGNDVELGALCYAGDGGCC
jgi:hypothetical protein